MIDDKKVKAAMARAQALTPEQRKDIAVKAATARWGTKPLRATHRGNFQGDFGIDVDCYVLDDAVKTAVVSQRGMAAALGIEDTSGRALPRVLETKRLAPFVGGELLEKMQNPLIFQQDQLVKNSLPANVYGYDVTVLIDICKVIIDADNAGALPDRQKNLVRQAHVIQSASAKAGIKGLVYALAGYDQTKEEVIAAFKLYVREEAREYEKEFPPQLYTEWYRLYGLKKPQRNKPWKFMHLTRQHVYDPLANSNGKILALTREQKARSDKPSKKLHQFLSEVGVKALRTHLGQLLGIAQIAESRKQYESFFKKVFGSQLVLDLHEEEE